DWCEQRTVADCLVLSNGRLDNRIEQVAHGVEPAALSDRDASYSMAVLDWVGCKQVWIAPDYQEGIWSCRMDRSVGRHESGLQSLDGGRKRCSIQGLAGYRRKYALLEDM